jgi:hypothetical protein
MEHAGNDPEDRAGADPDATASTSGPASEPTPPSAEDVVAAMETIVQWLFFTISRMAAGRSVHPG